MGVPNIEDIDFSEKYVESWRRGEPLDIGNSWETYKSKDFTNVYNGKVFYITRSHYPGERIPCRYETYEVLSNDFHMPYLCKKALNFEEAYAVLLRRLVSP